MQDLVHDHLSRLSAISVALGSDPRLVQGAGGNTSFKTERNISSCTIRLAQKSKPFRMQRPWERRVPSIPKLLQLEQNHRKFGSLNYYISRFQIMELTDFVGGS